MGVRGGQPAVVCRPCSDLTTFTAVHAPLLPPAWRAVAPSSTVPCTTVPVVGSGCFHVFGLVLWGNTMPAGLQPRGRSVLCLGLQGLGVLCWPARRGASSVRRRSDEYVTIRSATWRFGKCPQVQDMQIASKVECISSIRVAQDLPERPMTRRQLVHRRLGRRLRSDTRTNSKEESHLHNRPRVRRQRTTTLVAMATLTARLPVSGPTVAKTAYSRRYVIAAAASGRQGGTGGERAAGVSACNRRTAIGLGAIAATVAPLTQSTAYAAGPFTNAIWNVLVVADELPGRVDMCISAPRPPAPAQWTMLLRSKAHTLHLASAWPPRTRPSSLHSWQTT